jgi:hypothetical protein
MIYRETRTEALLAVRRIVDKHSDVVLAVRLGATDLSGLFGLRRDRAATSAGRLERLAFRALSAAWSRPWLYRLTTRAARRVNIRGQAPFMHVPVLRRWARTRDLRGRR